MLRLGILLTRSLAPAALCALALAACGSQRATSTTTTTTGATATDAKGTDATRKTLYIYSSLPHNGPQAAESHQIEQGVEFAMANVKHRVGAYLVKYRHLSDSTPQRASRSRSRKRKAVSTTSHGWNPAATIQSAVTAARNQQTVAYIGDLDSGATQLSLPILNQAGIVQLTPGSGYPGLTDDVKNVTSLGEPNKYYPQSRPSLFRLVPNDIIQAAAIVDWLKGYPSCHTVAAAAFGAPTPSTTSTALVAAIDQTAKQYKLAYVPASPPGNQTKSYVNYGHDLALKNVTCFVMVGSVTRAAVAFTTDLKRQLLGGSVIVGTNGFCNAGWSDQAHGGVPSWVAASLYCTTPALPLQYYPNGKSFRSKFRSRTRRTPTAYTYYGYLAGTLVLQAIREIGPKDSRSQVMSNLVTNLASADLETYTFDNHGDISSNGWNEYGLDKIDDGIPKPYKVLAPTHLLQSEP